MESSVISRTEHTLDPFLTRMARDNSLARIYSAGEVIFEEGQPGKTMILILTGQIRIIKKDIISKKPRTIAVRGSGDFLGEMALVENAPRFATLVAETDCEVIEFSIENFEKVPALAIRVLKSLSSKLRESDSHRIEDLKQANSRLNTTNQQLTQMNSFLDCVIDLSPCAMFLTTKTGDIFRMNRAAANMFGISDPESGININIFFSDFSIGTVRGGNLDIWQGRVRGLRDEIEFPVFLGATSLSGHAQSALYLLVCQEISELQEINDTAVDLQKYISGHNTALELAEEFNVYHNLIKENVDKIISNLTHQQTQELNEQIEAFRKTSRSLDKFTSDIKVFRADDSERQPLDIYILCKSVIDYFQSSKEYKKISFDLEVEPSMPFKISGKKGQIRYALMNLLVNSAEALLEDTEISQKKIRLKLGKTEDNISAVIKIIDNGPGIMRENQEKLSKERFTTKPGRFGTGLISVTNIVRGHKGQIFVNSQLGHGAVFELRFPYGG